jgi:hypothetical protein
LDEHGEAAKAKSSYRQQFLAEEKGGQLGKIASGD